MRYLRRPPTLACIMEEDRPTHTAATATNESSRSDTPTSRPVFTSDSLPCLTNQGSINARLPQPTAGNSALYLSHLLASKNVVESSTSSSDTRLDGNYADRLLIPTLPQPSSGEELTPKSNLSKFPQPDTRADKNCGTSLKVSSIRHKLSRNQIVRHFLSERGSFILKSSATCDSCNLDKREKGSAHRPLRMCPLCRSHLPPTGAVGRDTLYLPPVRRRSGKGQPLSFGNAIRAACAAGRRFYSVWTTVLVIWVITLVLICDLQSYSSSSPSNTVRTTIYPPKEETFALNSVLESSDPVLSEHLPENKDGSFDRNVVMIGDSMTQEAFSLLSTTSVSRLMMNLSTGVVALKEVSSTAPLHVQVFYEPLCPDSRHFIRYQLKSAIEQLGEYVDLQMVPYGKATTTEENGELSFQCQHGPTECLANKIHSCVVREIKDQVLQFKIIDCMIADNYKPKSIAQKCVTQVLGSGHWAPIQLCYTSRVGDQALKHMGSLTHSLDPSVSFIPTITINQSQDDQKHMLQDFTKVLCKRFKGTPPSACS